MLEQHNGLEITISYGFSRKCVQCQVQTVVFFRCVPISTHFLIIFLHLFFILCIWVWRREGFLFWKIYLLHNLRLYRNECCWCFVKIVNRWKIFFVRIPIKMIKMPQFIHFHLNLEHFVLLMHKCVMFFFYFKGINGISRLSLDVELP